MRSKHTPAATTPEDPRALTHAPAREKLPYRAFEESRQERRHLEIRLKLPQPSESPRYTALINIIHEWRLGQMLILDYGKAMVVVVQGRNLTPIYTALKEWRVEWVAEFGEDEYMPPTDPAAPFIESITVDTNRPEVHMPAKNVH